MSSSSNNPNPLLKLAIISSLITKSHKQGTLHLDDLYDLPDYLNSTSLTNKLEKNWLEEIKRCPQNPSLIRATLRTMRWKLILIGLLLIPLESFYIVQPLLLIYFIKFFEPCSTMFSWEAWLAALTVIMPLLCINLISHQYIYRVVMCAIQMRMAYSGLIFRKVLRLSSRAINNFSSGEIINLLANDANKVAPLQTTVVVLLLWYFVKYIIFIAVGHTLLLLLIQPLFSRLFLYLRTQVLKITDEHVKIMFEIIKSMRIVKMYCWESAFERKVRHTFLLFDESEQDNRLLSTSLKDIVEIDKMDENSIKQISHVICNLKQAQWQKNGKFLLKNIIFDAHPGDLICIIGSVESGKSSLLQTLTGEITYFDGKVRLYGSFCYVSQESWIVSSSIKNNILFGKKYNYKLFQRVVYATALDADFVPLSHGENTLVDDQGVMLSGGQKARVNMARALYRDADIYLLDDPLSAVDAKLRNKIRILVTHQIQFLQDATKIIVLDNGEMLLEDINQHEQEQQQPVSLLNQQSMVGSINSEKDNVDEQDINSLSKNLETKQEEQ
ncbi:unnamed protein product [Rotaria sp. Silwood1]|nr:unnamed protein product [Rotaria sp. Silwood1]CAF4630919.1 unnamed protein product [Rotaria sp. Silwood1]